MGKDIKFSFMVKKLLVKNNMTMKELGEKVGKTESAVSYWISGKSLPRMGTIQKVADVFGITTDELVFGDSPSQWGDDRSNREHLADKPELLDLYDEIRNRQEMYILFDKVRDLDPKDVESILAVVQTIRKAKGFEE